MEKSAGRAGARVSTDASTGAGNRIHGRYRQPTKLMDVPIDMAAVLATTAGRRSGPVR